MGWPFRPSTLRARLLRLVVGTALISCLGVGLAVFREARRGLEQVAFRAVGAIADARRTSLLLLVQRQRARSARMLARLQAECAHSVNPRACAEPELSSYREAEDAESAEVSLVRSPEPAAVETAPVPASLEKGPHGWTLRLTVFSPDDAGSLSLTVPIETLQRIFEDRSGLGQTGETFLTDPAGNFVTAPRYEAHSAVSHPIDSRPMKRCLAGESAEMSAPDYRGADVIHGFRFLPELGGACIMAHVTRPEAFAPIDALRDRILLVTVAFLAIAILSALVVARALVRPLQALTATAVAIEQGAVVTPVEQGSLETRTLARAFARTIASLRSAVAAEQAARDQAESALRARDEFLSIAGHELRTPLTALRLQLQLLGKTFALPEHVSDRLERQAIRLTALVDQLLDVARITAGQLTLHREPIDAAAVVREVAGRLSEVAERAGSPLRVAADQAAPGSFDAARLDQVATNLIANALKYGAGQPVDVAVTAEEGGLRISVADRGIGVAPQDRARIFQRFERAVSSHQYGGLGLGLWITRQIVEAHGGRIAVSDRPGGGALFEVFLPGG